VRDRLTVRSGDVELAVEVTGSGPPLLWAHGLLSSKELALDMLRHVVGIHRVAVYDQRGHGESSASGEFGLDALAADLAAVMHALGWERAVLGGDSMGAAVVLEVARRDPAAVRSLVVDRPAFGDEPRPALVDDARFIRREGLPAWVDWKLGAATAPERRLLDSRYAAMWRAQDGASIAAAYDAVSAWVQPLDDLAAITAPAVVRGCADDPIHPLALARRLARALDADLLESTRLEALDPERDARAVEMAVRRAGA